MSSTSTPLQSQTAEAAQGTAQIVDVENSQPSTGPPFATAAAGVTESRPSDEALISVIIDGAPLPPAQVERAYGDAEDKIDKEVERIHTDDAAPPFPAKIAAVCDEVECATKKRFEHTPRDDGAPQPPAQVAAANDWVEDRIKKKIDSEKAPRDRDAPLTHATALRATTGVDDDAPPIPMAATMPAPPLPLGEQGANSEAQPHSSSAVLQESPPPPDNRSTSHSEATLSANVSALPSPQAKKPESVPMLEGTLAPDVPVFEGVQVDEGVERTFFRKNRRGICAMTVGLLGGVAVVIGVALQPKESNSVEESIWPNVSGIGETGQLSESFSPSLYRTLHPSLRPSQSASPSQSPSRFLRPSLSPSTSIAPSALLYCGEINVITDDNPLETSWKLSKNITVDGVPQTEIVLRGFPEGAGHHKDKVCLEMGNYQFTMSDSAGDGICCLSGQGHYNMTMDGTVIARGGEFESEETFPFSLPIPSVQPSQSVSPTKLPTSSPSFQPSQSSSPSETLSPSFQPSISLAPSTFWSSLKWNQQGQDINGEDSSDWLGLKTSFSADGMTVAIGAPGDWAYNDRPGFVKVFSREGEVSPWEQQGDTIYGESDGGAFGYNIALSGDGKTMAVGAPFHDSNSGQVTVYKWNDETLNYKQLADKLYGDEETLVFGFALALSSDGMTLAVGAPFSSSDQVRVYAWDEDDFSFKYQKQVIDEVFEGYSWSLSLSRDGKKMALGLPETNGNTGQAIVFLWDEAFSSYKRFGGSIIGDAANDSFGWSVSLSEDGNILAIGAPFALDANGEDRGQVKTFQWDGVASSLNQLGRSIYGEAAGDYFGWAVALSSDGKTLAVGADQYGNGKPGWVQVYAWDEANFRQLGNRINGEADGDGFGAAVALLGDGKVLALGAPGNNGNGAESGEVKIVGVDF